MQHLQKTVSHFVKQHQLETSIELRLLDLVSEIGELGKEALKASQYGACPFAPSPSWEEELGDVLFSLICLANQSSVDLERALFYALEKYRDRIIARGGPQSGND